MKKSELKKILIELFTENIEIKDELIHSTAEELKLSKDAVENTIYGLLSSFLHHGRYNEAYAKPEIDEQELAAGTKVEMEHTNDPIIAQRIALDHLTESEKYIMIT